MPEQTDTKEFTITRVFEAPRDVVWRAWTADTEVATWWHPRGIEVKAGSTVTDVRVGGRYAYTMVNPLDGQEYPTAGVYREVSPPERLVFTWASPNDADDEAPVITVELSELPDDRTGMRFHMIGWVGEPGDGNVYDGWASAFDMLAEHLADHRGHL
ncbi:SRPBCC family protein [Microbacterium flavescens]|jgi:uncharacterized protein YndB with AHSA1/START domain|uniref:SRPBCC family protein n=1 Tax=Microbacterium flavescens TaxID=69366 RepID=UPI001BDE32B6|nr:SRPBCC domain-containing protein [Microbacterium flavescens]BFF10047.1 SRPBCC domain-containing protein [Microbacterium flavescens]